MSENEEKQKKEPKTKAKTLIPKPTGASLLKVIGVSVLIVAVLVAAVLYFSGSLKGIGTNNYTKANNVVSINPDAVISMQAYSDGVVLLTDNETEYYDKQGNLIAANDHNFANPVLKLAGENALIYDNGGNGLLVEKNGNNLQKLTLKSTIMTAAVGKQSNYAYVLDSVESRQSMLYVYSYKGEMLFKWGCASYITAVSLSDNGRYVAVGVYNTENAAGVSQVHLFNFGQDDPIYSVEYTGELVFDISFQSTKKLTVFTDKGVYATDKNGESTSLQSYTSDELGIIACQNGVMGATAIHRYGDTKNELLTVFTKLQTTQFTENYTQPLQNLFINEKYIASVFDNYALVYSMQHKLVGNITWGEKSIATSMNGRTLYVLFADGVRSYSVNTLVSTD